MFGQCPYVLIAIFWVQIIFTVLSKTSLTWYLCVVENSEVQRWQLRKDSKILGSGHRGNGSTFHLTCRAVMQSRSAGLGPGNLQLVWKSIKLMRALPPSISVWRDGCSKNTCYPIMEQPLCLSNSLFRLTFDYHRALFFSPRSGEVQWYSCVKFVGLSQLSGKYLAKPARQRHHLFALCSTQAVFLFHCKISLQLPVHLQVNWKKTLLLLFFYTK